MQNPAKKLFEISEKTSRVILGLMSGTSLDGLDLALCNISGTGFATSLTIQEFETRAYEERFAFRLSGIFAKEYISQKELTFMHRDIGKRHGAMVNDFLKKFKIRNEEVDLIASHGQTIFHIPGTKNEKAATLQIGDADEIASHTGLITLSDFRQKHIAAGGEGAPLVPYGDLLLFRSHQKSRVLINIGGIANLSFIPSGKNHILCTDTGPGNTLIDAVVRKELGKPFDAQGDIARSGMLSEPLLNALQEDPFFQLPIPKSTGPELFNLRWLENILTKKEITLSPQDLIHTLTVFTAKSIAQVIAGLKNFSGEPEIFISGGGIHNRFLTQLLSRELGGIQIRTTQELGINPDAKEAALFALLANECVAGEPEVFEGTGLLPLRMGKISFPN